jgi:membrane protein implicated in regulation of membrane protease activity
MKNKDISYRIYHDFYCPLVGIGLALIGIAYAIAGFFVLLGHILGTSFFAVASIVLIGLTMTLQSMGQETWASMSLHASIPVIALYGVTSVIESMMDRRSRKMKRN